MLSLTQMARLQSSMIFKAASSLNFQEDMIGSINMLLCGRQPDINSTKMTLSLGSPRQVVNNKSVFIMGNSSGKCYSKVLFKAKLSQSTCISFIYLPFRFTVQYVVAGNGKCQLFLSGTSGVQCIMLTSYSTFVKYGAGSIILHVSNCGAFGKRERNGKYAWLLGVA